MKSENKQIFIELKNICKSYDGTQFVLNGVSFSLHKGEIFSLLGVNGAGKTTLSGIISTLHPATSGDIVFNGKSIYADIPDYRLHIGLCPQHPNLNPYLTVEQNLYFSGRAYRFSHEDSKQRAKELIEALGLQKYASALPETLSGGYKQRTSIARTLMHRPSLVILDEPTVGLDPHVRRNLWSYISSLRDQGITILLTTHYLEEAEILSDRVCVLDKGVIKLIETPESLKTSFSKSSLEHVFLELIKEEKEENI